MVIIKLQPLREFMATYPDARPSLSQWVQTVEQASWGTPNELKAVYPSASLVGNDRVVFNIGGNKYQLVVLIIYRVRTVFVRFIGPHSAYDQVDVSTIQASPKMLSLQTSTTVTPIRSAAELVQAHLRLDELLAANAFESADEDVRDEVEVFTALIYYYEQRTKQPGEFAG